MTQPKEPANPIYLLLLVACVIFVATIFAYVFVPILEEKAKDMGQMPPPSPFRDALRTDGWRWLLVEVAVIVILGIASMALDRYRRLVGERKPRDAASP